MITEFNMINKIRAFGIFSGGLDSLLSARLLMDQGLTPTLITFTSPFFALDQARAGAAQLGLPLTEVDFYPELLALIKNPPNGLGRNLNPCIDCHALMFKKAGDLLEATGEDGFLFSGEVLGQRPMSQNPTALKTVAKHSGRRDMILRPLSAKIMGVTPAEEKGWVDRERLLGLSGRGRRPQIELAKGYGYQIPTPAGGCLLTDVGFSKRFKWLMDQPQGVENPAWPPARLANILKCGRLFSAEPGQWLVVGRNQNNNKALASLMRDGDTVFHLEGAPGPTVLLPNLGMEAGEQTLHLGRSVAAAYGDNGGASEALVRVDLVGGSSSLIKTTVAKTSDWESFMVMA